MWVYVPPLSIINRVIFLRHGEAFKNESVLKLINSQSGKTGKTKAYFHKN